MVMAMISRLSLSSISGCGTRSLRTPLLSYTLSLPAAQARLAVLIVAFGMKVCGAEQPARIRRIGYLAFNTASSASERSEIFRHGFRDLGYELTFSLNGVTQTWRNAVTSMIASIDSSAIVKVPP